MGADEEGTLKRLKRCAAISRSENRRAPRPHRQTTGDGMLVEFPSLVDAAATAST